MIRALIFLLTLSIATQLSAVEPTDWPYCCCFEVQCGTAGGSGTLVGIAGTKGLGLTAAHVVEGGSRVTCEFSSGYKCTGRIIGRDSRLDLAAISLPVKPGMTTPRKVRPATRSDKVLLAVGYPYYSDGRPHWTTGPYLGYQGSDVQFKARPYIHSGFSGGTLLSMDGDYLGSTNGYGTNYSYAASGPALMKFVSRWMKTHAAERPSPDGVFTLPVGAPGTPDFQQPKQPKQPTTPAAVSLIDFAPRYRELNTDGSCGYIATANCLRFCGLWREAQAFRQRWRGPSSDGSISAALRSMGIKHQVGHGGDEKLLRWSIEQGRGAAVTWGGAHVVNLVGIEGENAVLMGNQSSGIKEYRREAWREFIANHRAAGGWSIVVLAGDPGAPAANRTPPAAEPRKAKPE